MARLKRVYKANYKEFYSLKKAKEYMKATIKEEGRYIIHSGIEEDGYITYNEGIYINIKGIENERV